MGGGTTPGFVGKYYAYLCTLRSVNQNLQTLVPIKAYHFSLPKDKSRNIVLLQYVWGRHCEAYNHTELLVAAGELGARG